MALLQGSIDELAAGCECVETLLEIILLK